MITLDTNLTLICSLFNISLKKISDEYSGMTVDEIMKAEAAAGNAAAARFDKEILSNPHKLIEAFGLDNVRNKFAILNNLNEHDIEELLPLLGQQDLAIGLKFFDKDKLVELTSRLPKEQLVKYVLQMFSPEQVMNLMPVDSMNKFLQSNELEKGLVLKHLKSMKPELLAQMLESVTGKAVESTNQQELISQISQLEPQKYKDALISIPEEQKRIFLLKMTKEEPKLFQLFNSDGYAKILSTKEKPELIKAASVIEPEHLIKILKELPKDLLAVVMTQIDPKDFADVLIKEYKDVLKQIVAA